MSNKKDSMLTLSLTEKASMWGASCETRKGFALTTAVTKGIHLEGIVSNKKRFNIDNIFDMKRIGFGGIRFQQKIGFTLRIKKSLLKGIHFGGILL